jgi:hypothetical protein
MKIIKLFLMKIGVVSLLIACATVHNESQIVYTQKQMQQQYQAIQRNFQLGLERKKKGIFVHEYGEFSRLRNLIEDMKREKIPLFLHKFDPDSRLCKIIVKELLSSIPEVARAQKNSDGTRKWSPYDWAYSYCYGYTSGSFEPLSYAYGTYATAKSMGYIGEVPFDPVPFVKIAEKRGYNYYTIKLTPERSTEARILQIFMFFDKEDRYQGYVFCTYL